MSLMNTKIEGLLLDPADRQFAVVSSHGNAGVFNNPEADMYEMAAEYASCVTDGAVRFIRKDGTEAPVTGYWDSTLWIKKWKERNAGN